MQFKYRQFEVEIYNQFSFSREFGIGIAFLNHRNYFHCQLLTLIINWTITFWKKSNE